MLKIDFRIEKNNADKEFARELLQDQRFSQAQDPWLTQEVEPRAESPFSFANTAPRSRR